MPTYTIYRPLVKMVAHEVTAPTLKAAYAAIEHGEGDPLNVYAYGIDHAVDAGECTYEQRDLATDTVLSTYDGRSVQKRTPAARRKPVRSP